MRCKVTLEGVAGWGALLAAEGVQGERDLGTLPFISQNAYPYHTYLLLPYLMWAHWYRNRNPKGLVPLLCSSITSEISFTFYFYKSVLGVRLVI